MTPTRRTAGAARVLLCAAIGLLALATRAQERIDAPHCARAVSPEDALRRLNALRVQGASCGASARLSIARPVRWNEQLADAAAAQADAMVRLRRMVHRDDSDRPLGPRLNAAGYRYSSAFENIAVGYDSFDAVVDAWLASEGHCTNMLDAGVLEVGIACSDDHGDRYWTLVLGAPSRR